MFLNSEQSLLMSVLFNKLRHQYLRIGEDVLCVGGKKFRYYGTCEYLKQETDWLFGDNWRIIRTRPAFDYRFHFKLKGDLNAFQDDLMLLALCLD